MFLNELILLIKEKKVKIHSCLPLEACKLEQKYLEEEIDLVLDESRWVPQ